METDIISSTLEVMPPGTPNRLSPDISHQEPPMHLHRPSSDRTQDVSHILASLFENLYTRDVLSPDTIENLTGSSEGSSDFHRKCMKELSKVQDDHKKTLEEYNMLERHIIQARARGATADEKVMQQIAGTLSESECEKIGLPPVDSHFRWCLDEDMLRKHKLIVPSDLFTKPRQLMEGPGKPLVPHFSLPTLSSSIHFLKEPLDDGFIHDEARAVESPRLSRESDEKSITTLSSDSAERVSVPARHKIKKSSTESSEKDRWRDSMKPADRMKDREILARLEERHNFLKNPRFLAICDPRGTRLLTKLATNQMKLKAGRMVAKEVRLPPDIQVFEAFPKVVLFTEWVVGRVYETVLNLRNVSSVCRQMRVHPPQTSYFSLGLGKYPGIDSLVAPGISSRFNVRFMPDSLADYEDHIEVISQVGTPLIVKIVAKRDPPLLTLGERIRCGSCLVGGAKIIELPIKNLGGPGRFCILKRSMWPAANFKTVVNPGCLDVGAFQIRPSVFEIFAGQSTMLEILFSPEETKKYQEELVIVCDNCQIVHFSLSGEGERAGVELISVSDGGEENHGMGEIGDLTANHYVKFPALNPHSFYMRQMIVHNSTKVEMPYSWHILKPNLTSAQDQLLPPSEVNWEALEFYPDDNPCFFVEPMQGTLQPDGIHEFVVTFAPHQVGTYHAVLHLVLSDIPNSQVDTKQQLSVQGKLPPSVDVVEKMATTREESASKLARSSSQSLAQGSTSKVSPLRKVISMEVELSGESIPYAVVIHPLAVVVTGNILIGTTVRRPLQMANYSLAPIQFQWECETSPNIVEIKPPMGVIGPGEIADLEVTVTGLECGPLACDLLCRIEHQEKPIRLNVVANIEGPTVAVDNLMIDFGLMRLGETPSTELFIRNTTQLNATWALRIEDQERIGLTLRPQNGELTSLEQRAIKVTYNPTSCQTLNTCIYLDVIGGHGSSVAVHAEVQTPQVCFRDCTMVLQDVYLSVPKPTTAVLINQTSFPTSFNFDRVRGNKDCEVTVHPDKGVLAPREEREVEVVFTSHIEGEVTDVYLPCVIEGMKDMIVLGFYANTQVLNVEFTTPGYDGAGLKVTYDSPVDVGQTVTSRVVITNLTAIRAPWSANVHHFKAANPQPKPPSYDFKSVKTRRALLGRTPNMADPFSKSSSQVEAEHKALMLSDGKGVAFNLDPPRGFLEPYQSQVIVVVAYNNMWGKYKDEMTITVKGFETQTIPIELNVSGCPLAFQVAHDKDQAAMVRYGSHLEGGPNVPRKLRINNKSPHDIRLDWQTFNYPSSDDHKLVDLNIWFGEAFPLKKPKARQSVGGRSKASYSSSSLMLLNSAPKSASDEAQQNLVHVKIDPHLGAKSDIPFRIEPDQVIVPARGHVTVSSIFQPFLQECSDEKGQQYSSFALGFISLDDENVKNQEEKLSRDDGYSVNPLRLELRSYVRAGLLHLETQDDEDVTSFHLPLSDLLKEEREALNVQQTHTLTLFNPTEAVLHFRLAVKKPFFLAFDNSKRNHHTLPLTCLPPQHNIKVQVIFCVDNDVTSDLGKLRTGQTLDGVTLHRDDVFDTEMVEYKTSMQINYCNGMTQVHPLAARVSCPSFQISTTDIDFGTCFVGQEVSHLVTIVNRSGADTRWRARVAGVSNPTLGAFRLDPREGFLQAFTDHSAENKTTFAVFYVAKSDDICSASIVFEGSLGEPTRLLSVTGLGSFDGTFELK